jgi:hypothetical protein
MMAVETTAAGYDNAQSIFLSCLVAQAVQQFETNQGSITPPAGWKQIAAFQAPELTLSDAVQKFLAMHPQIASRVAALGPADADPALNAQVSAALTDPVMLQALAVGVRKVFFGFALVPDTGDTSSKPGNSNVAVFRGTQTTQEWVFDATGFQVPVPLVWFSHGSFSLAKVHLGFLIQYALLADQVAAATAQFDSSLPSFFTGHSLGSALATIAAITAKVKHLFAHVRMYNYASPRVGDPTFVSAYNFFLPDSFRIVNLADIVPALPPKKLDLTVLGHTFDFTYAHVGSEQSYLWQSGNVAFNHELSDTYIPTVQQGTLSGTQPAYPTTAICG